MNANRYVARQCASTRYRRVKGKHHRIRIGGYRTPAEVYHGGQGDVDGEINRRRYSPEKGTLSLAGEPEFSLNSALILSK